MNTKDLKPGLFLNPYPHVVVENYFSDKDYSELVAEAVRFEEELRRNQKPKIAHGEDGYTSGDFFYSEQLDKQPALQRVCRHFCSADFRVKLAEVLGPYAHGRLSISPEGIVNRAKSVSGDSSRTAFYKFSGKDVPKLRVAHVDGSLNIITYLYYIRLPNDFSTGGDFLLHGYERTLVEGNGMRKLFLRVKRLARPLSYHFIKAVDYRPNTFVAFLNGPDSIHEVTLRKNANVNRIAIQGSISSEQPVF